MGKIASRVYAALLAGVLLYGAGPAYGAVTGKVSGRVTDRTTGEPLPGVGVQLVGMRIGSTTDADGIYFIINVQPGQYDVMASMVGFRGETRSGIRVNADRTTQANFRLEPTAIEVEGVTITAPREVIQLDVSGSAATFEQAELVATPRRSLQEALALQPGIGVTGSIRGGNLDETQVVVDGRLAVDERLNTPIMTVSSSALEEVQVLTGGFSAEYGNARSGVFNVVTRNAVDQPLWTTIDATYYPSHTKFFEPGGYSAFGENSYEWRTFGNEDPSTVAVTTKLDPEDASKTVPDTLHKGWSAIAATPASNPKGLSAAQLRDKWRHQHPAWDYGNKPDYVIDAAVGVPIVPALGIVLSGRRDYTSYATPQYRPAYIENLFSAKLNLRPLDPLRMDLTFTFGTIEGLGTSGQEGLTNSIYRDFGPSIGFLGPSAKYAQYNNPSANTDRFAVAGNLTYSFNTSSFVEAGVDYNAIDYKIGPPNVVVNRRAGQEGVVIFTGTAGSDTVNSLPVGFLGEGFPDGTRLGYELGGANAGMDSSDYTSIRLFGAYTNQINTRNLVKIGLEGVLIDLNQYGGHVGPKDYVVQKWDASPTRIGAFVQDRIEYEGMIANIGVRLDYFDSGADVIEPNDLFSDIFDENKWGDRTVITGVDPFADIIARYGSGGTTAADSVDLEAASAKVQLSPRLGVSHPIGQYTKVFFNYGHFYTVPSNQSVYGWAWNQPGSISYMGNPDLELPRTISYELGAEQELMRQYLIRTSVFYKDATNEIAGLGFTSSGPQKYTRTIPYNKAYSDIRGFEFSVAKRAGMFITGFVNGGVQTKTTTLVGDREIFSQKDFVGTRPVEEVPPIARRASPYGRINIDLHTPVGFAAFGLPAVAAGGWSVSWLTEYSRGGDAIYDPVGSGYVKSPNVYTQDWWMSDMRVTKNFAFGGSNVAAYMDILNVLDRKIWNGGMTAQQYQDYLRSLHFPVDDPLIEDTKGNDKIGDTPSYAKLPQTDQWALWKYPRTFGFGLRVSF